MNKQAEDRGRRKALLGRLAITFCTLFIISLSTSTATADGVRSAAEGFELLTTEVKNTYSPTVLHLGFFKITYQGGHTTLSANYYTDKEKITAKLLPGKEPQLSLFAIKSSNQREKWANMETARNFPNLDGQLIDAEKKVRGDGFQPTGIVILQYHFYPPVKPGAPFRSRTLVLFQVEAEQEARAVHYENGIFKSHTKGTILKIPALNIPRITMPELTRINNPLKGVGDEAVESFRVDDQETLLRIEGDFLFDFDSDQPRPEAAELILAVAELIQEQQPEKVAVEGHTDSWGTPVYNDDLSLRRARAILEKLVAAGVNPDLLEARGFGETRLVASELMPDGTDDPAGRQKNRRVEVRLLQP